MKRNKMALKLLELFMREWNACTIHPPMERMHHSRTTKVQGRQNGACKNFTRAKNRSQARLHRRQISSDSSRLVRTVGKGGAKRQWRSEGGKWGHAPRRAPPRGAPRSFFIVFFSTYSHRFLKLLCELLYCNVCCSQRIQITPYFRPQITLQRGAQNSDFIHSSFDVIF